MKNVIAPQRERLKRLYQIGVDVPFEDDEGSFSVWLQKIVPAENKEAVAHSYKSRAKTLTLLKADPDDADLIAFTDALPDWGLDTREARVRFLITDDLQKAQKSIEEKIAYDSEWSENDYLVTLQEAWNDGLKEKFALDPEHDEAKRVFVELKRYTEEVNKLVEIEEQELFDAMDENSDETILQRTIKVLIEYQAGMDQTAEYHKWVIYFAARNPENHDERYFESREDLETYPPEIFSKLLEEYILLALDQSEGKDQQATPISWVWSPPLKLQVLVI